MTLDEYTYITNNFKPLAFEELLFKARIAYEQNNIIELKNLQNKEFIKATNQNCPYAKYNSIMINALMIDLDKDINIASKDIEILCDYLFKVDNWGLYEIILFGNSLNILPKNFRKLLSKEILQKTKIYINIKKNKEELVRVLINTVIISLHENDLSHMRFLIEEVEKLLQNTTFYFEKVRILYLKGVYLIVTNNKEEGITLAKNAIDILYILDNQIVAENFKKHLKNYE